MVAIAFLFDILFTVAIAYSASYWQTRRALQTRTTQFSPADVRIYREMRDTMRDLTRLDELGVVTLPEQIRTDMRALVVRHDKEKELPA